jgi:dephospho-CoA kinase
MPGAGKSTVANLLKEKEFYIVNMGDIIREKAIEKNLELTDKNIGELMKELRREHGNEIVAKLILEKVRNLKEKRYIVIDGIRSFKEFGVLSELGFVRLLAIHASPDTRYYHIKQRERSDMPPDYEKFLQRDKREMDIGIAEAIALADEAICNNTATISELKDTVDKIVSKWVSEYGKEDIITVSQDGRETN